MIGAAYAFTLRAAFDSMVFLLAAKVPLKLIKRLGSSGGLTLLSIIAASDLQGDIKYPALGALLLASTIWKLFNIPDVLRPYAGRFSVLLPNRQWELDGLD